MANQVILLPVEMFDNGSFECYNFWLADQDGIVQVDASSDVIQHCKSQIEARMALGKSHLVCKGLVYGGVEIFEIQWG